MRSGWLRAGAASLAALAAIAGSQFAWVRPTNFGGIDEWLYLSLNSRGIVCFPHSNRPLALLWSLPAVLVAPHRFTGYFAVHVVYLLLGGWLTWALARRLEPAAPRLAVFAGAFALVWAPLDMARLATVQTSMNSGATCATLLALVLLVESWRQARPGLLVIALLVACLAARSYEATLGPLAGAPLLLVGVDAGKAARDTERARWRWVFAWEAWTAFLAALAARPLLEGGSAALYQTDVLGADLHPTRYLGRLARQYVLHLRPLWPDHPSELAYSGVWLAVLIFLVSAGAALAVHRGPPQMAPEHRRRLARAALVGLAMAGLGYSVLVMSPAVVDATRMQFLSGAGIALFLAAAITLLGALLPTRLRAPAELLAAATVVAVGTGHTLAMQREWDRIGLFPAQRRSLVGLLRQAPSLRAHTLLLLIDEEGTWPYALTFRHAVRLVYGPDVVGHSLGSNQLLYRAAMSGEGLHVAPWPVVRGPWRESPTFHGFNEVIVFRLSGGRAVLVDTWSHPRLPNLPEGARYAPRERITTEGASPPGRRALD